jgi:hypothetical protein
MAERGHVPPIHFVAECTTMSAPKSMGRQKYPPAPNVLSTITGIPASCAMATIFSKSGMLYFGLPILSSCVQVSQPSSPDYFFQTHVNSLGLLVNRGLEVVGLVSIDELSLNAQTWEEDFQLVICTSVQVRRCDYVVPSMCKSGNRNELCSLSRCCS